MTPLLVNHELSVSSMKDTKEELSARGRGISYKQ
jgi:hypothetical protein